MTRLSRRDFIESGRRGREGWDAAGPAQRRLRERHSRRRQVCDLLLELLEPKLVRFQFQMSTITAGFVGAEYLLKCPGRFNSMHLQDLDMNAPVPPPPAGGRGGRRPQVALGKGNIDWMKTFTAAKAAGIRSYYVEQNRVLTRQSVAHLKTLVA
jgi:hypothetical protein